jgi:DNA-binding NarL/FixJ family response regulator
MSQVILIVDGDPEFRVFVSRRLQRLGYAIREAATGEEALATVRREQPAFVLLEVRLPDMTGYEVLRELREEHGEGLAIVLISGERTEPLDRVGGLLLGADDYLAKPIDADELLARVRRVVARPAQVARSQPTAPVDACSELTARERQVLRLLAGGLAPQDIAGELSISAKTVATHIQHVLTKLGVHSRIQAVAIAHSAGLLERST